MGETVANFGERYELIRRIGSGDAGEVWLAQDGRLAGRPVAVKIMHRRVLAGESDIARVEREMRFAAMLDHPNIVTVYRAGIYDGVPFTVMEYLRGNDLEKVLPGGDAGHIAGIGRDACGALAYAHRAGVLHRDIKPGNLFLCENGRVKVTDFGIAGAVSGTMPAADLAGTLAYLPPERWRREPPAPGNDVWAVGCVLYRLISGRLPRVLPDAAGYAAAAVRGDPVPELHDFTEAPAWLTGAVMAMLAAAPADRPTADDCIRLLAGPRFPPPARGRRVHGQPVPGRPGTAPAIAAADGEPVTTPARRAAAARPATGRSRRGNRAVIAAGFVAFLFLAGSVTAWRLSASPQVQHLAVRSSTTSLPASHAAATTPPASAPVSRSASAPASRPPSAAAPPPAPVSASPARSRPASPASSRSASPSHSASASPSRSASASPSGTPTASATASASPSGSPSMVKIPSVTGMTFTKAKLLLESDGFTVAGRQVSTGQIVIRTNPAGQAPAGSRIVVVYGTAP